jgi:hypothetical protein
MDVTEITNRMIFFLISLPPADRGPGSLSSRALRDHARHGGLVAWAKQLGRHDCAQLLQQNEEKSADEKLAALAEARVNRAAA